jgi:hypothetical protein
MSPEHRRSLAAAVLCAAALRAGLAVLTEFTPIFPPYYYTDANFYNEQSIRTARHWKDPASPMPNVEPHSLAYVGSTAALYRFLGENILLPKLANALLASAAIGLWALIVSAAFGESAGLWMAWLLCLWPSAAFFQSQNLKESQALLAEALSLFFFLRHLRSPAWPLPAGGILALLALGFHRTQLMVLVCLALLPGCLARRGARSWAAAASMLLALALHRPAGKLLDDLLCPAPAWNVNLEYRFVPQITDPQKTTRKVSPLSPAGLGEFRRLRMQQAQWWARSKMERDIGTQIYPDAEFSSWLDVALFLPKGMAQALFMPLPGLYPMEGRAGRMLAAAENALLLLLSLAALAGLARRRPDSPEAWTLAALFALSAAAYGLFEFDLGSAARHRMQYLPCLLAFIPWPNVLHFLPCKSPPR